MKFNSPLPQTLPKECNKAARIFGSFVDGKNNGLDGVIPRSVLENAKGFAIFTIFKAGFVFSARAGTGIVIAKLGDGSWSAPSAIGTAGLGVGGQLGAEMTDFLVVLNSNAAVKSFMSAGSLTLGGNMSIAVGPLGRNGEATGSVNSRGNIAAMYSYSKTRGLFGGVSLEGSVIVERQDANALAYNQDVTARMLLSGSVACPDWASALVKTLESCTGMPGARTWIDDRVGESTAYAFGGAANATPSPKSRRFSSFLGKKKNIEFPPQHWGLSKENGPFSDDTADDGEPSRWDGLGSPEPPSASNARTDSAHNSSHRPRHHSHHSASDAYDPASPFNSLPPFQSAHSNLSERTVSHSRSLSVPSQYRDANRLSSDYTDPFASTPPSEDDLEQSRNNFNRVSPFIKTKPELTNPLSPLEGVARAIALYDFKAVETGDLTFSKGDVIVVTRKSDSTDDWWTGKVHGKEGIFPANFVEVV
ncbi:hypothetical protein F5I97DRAFT_1896922 [Phlebopus sp. FC_14]|nr:hypothetical protein F5I97DRAFT_1896922 [Phlebopus sp. FC_14]